MYDFLFLLLWNSIPISIIIVVYTAITHLYLERYIVKWRYYTWLIIILGLIIPIRPEFHMVIPQNNGLTKFIKEQQLIPQQITETMKSTNQAMQSASAFSWHYVFVFLWVLGVLMFILYHVVRHLKFQIMVKRWSKEINEPQALKTLKLVQEELKLYDKTKLLLCPFVQSPMMIGFFQPIIIIPNLDYSNKELFYIFKHELIHFKRKDLWYKSLVVFVTAIYWYNPIIYLMAKEISIQCELSCDEKTIFDTDYNGRQEYGIMILSVIRDHKWEPSIFMTQFYNGKKEVKNRILSIMNMNKKRGGIGIGGVLVVCMLVFGANITIRHSEALVAAEDGLISNEDILTVVPDIITKSGQGIGASNIDLPVEDEKDKINVDIVHDSDQSHHVQNTNTSEISVADVTIVQNLDPSNPTQNINTTMTYREDTSGVRPDNSSKKTDTSEIYVAGLTTNLDNLSQNGEVGAKKIP